MICLPGIDCKMPYTEVISVKAMPHVTISSPISSTIHLRRCKDSVQHEHCHEFVNDIVTCGRAFVCKLLWEWIPNCRKKHYITSQDVQQCYGSEQFKCDALINTSTCIIISTNCYDFIQKHFYREVDDKHIIDKRWFGGINIASNTHCSVQQW